MWLLAANLGQLAGIKAPPAELDQSVGPALGGAALVVWHRFAQGVEGGGERGTTDRVEQAVQVEEPVPGLAQMQAPSLISLVGILEGAVRLEGVAEIAGH